MSTPLRFIALIPATARNALAMLARGKVMVLVAALALVGLAVSPVAPSARLLASGSVATLLAAALLSQTRDEPGIRPADLGRVMLATLLLGLVLGFLLLLAVLAGGVVVFAVMAGAGFDFDAAGAGRETFDVAFAAFLATPAGAMSQAAFFLALAIWAIGLGRVLPYAAASVACERVIVLEAFNLSRGRGLVFTALLIVALLPCLLLWWIASSLASGAPLQAAILTGSAWVSGTLGIAAASTTAGNEAINARPQRESE